VFRVDDSFIGNRKIALQLTRELAVWQKRNEHPMSFYTEASIDLADRLELLAAMVEANFMYVFIGIERPSAEEFNGSPKFQNLRGDLIANVNKIRENGYERNDFPIAQGFDFARWWLGWRNGCTRGRPGLRSCSRLRTPRRWHQSRHRSGHVRATIGQSSLPSKREASGRTWPGVRTRDRQPVKKGSPFRKESRSFRFKSKTEQRPWLRENILCSSEPSQRKYHSAKEDKYIFKRLLTFSVLVLAVAQIAVASDREDDVPRTQKAAQVFKEIMDTPDRGIPHDLLDKLNVLPLFRGIRNLRSSSEALTVAELQPVAPLTDGGSKWFLCEATHRERPSFDE
jgi:hypothetical protein